MTPILIGGILVALVGTGVLLAHAFRAGTGWGVACLLLPPAQWAFVLMNWKKTWEALLMQFMGIVLALAAVISIGGGLDSMARLQAWSELKHSFSLASQPTSGTTVLASGQQVSSVTAPEEPDAVNDGTVTAIQGNDALVSVTVTAKPEKAVDTKPIYKCTDAAGKERFSREPCGGPQPVKKP